ncbi:hypothetical protein LguiA_009708 [Lonicera macranthoides]
MPPEASSSPLPRVSPVIPLLATVDPKSRLHLIISQKRSPRMAFAKKNLIPILVFVLTILSIIRLIKITIATSSSPPAAFLQTLQTACTSPPCLDIRPHNKGPSTSLPISYHSTTLTGKEFQFLSEIISHRAPCNLLFFGLEQQYLNFSSLNDRGTTVFLEDNPNKLSKIKMEYNNNTRVYRVEYKAPAKEGYKLLKHARKNPGCFPHSGIQEISKCKLELTGLPKQVSELKWDVVVVDGPNGDGPEAPGRMAAIYTASVLARRGNVTDVVVHDIDRTIEKWFSWEFLCEKNLVSSKGKFWNFRIAQQSNFTSFCSV